MQWRKIDQKFIFYGKSSWPKILSSMTFSSLSSLLPSCHGTQPGLVRKWVGLDWLKPFHRDILCTGGFYDDYIRVSNELALQIISSLYRKELPTFLAKRRLDCLWTIPTKSKLKTFTKCIMCAHALVDEELHELCIESTSRPSVSPLSLRPSSKIPCSLKEQISEDSTRFSNCILPSPDPLLTVDRTKRSLSVLIRHSPVDPELMSSGGSKPMDVDRRHTVTIPQRDSDICSEILRIETPALSEESFRYSKTGAFAKIIRVIRVRRRNGFPDC